MNANVWQWCVEPGQQVNAGDRIMILEAMKMEITVTTSASGIVRELTQPPGREVKPGQILALIATTD